jgi:hypothetical protein
MEDSDEEVMYSEFELYMAEVERDWELDDFGLTI